jgi:hypothetical protein
LLNTKTGLIIFLAMTLTFSSYAEDSSADLEEVNVFDSLKKSEDLPSTDTSSEMKSESTSEAQNDKKLPNKSGGEDIKMSTLEEQDDLLSLKEDIGEVVFPKTPTAKETEKAKDPGPLKASTPKMEVAKDPIIDNKKDDLAATEIKEDNSLIFDTGKEEKILLDQSKYVQNKISKKDWDELAVKSKLEKYEVQKGDYLWKISKKIFGSGFYYAKIWSLNPQITNPHEIEPGTILAFDSGDADTLPNVQVSEFTDDEVVGGKRGSSYAGSDDSNQPAWIKERKKLIDQGVYFQFASEETYEDLERLEKQQRSNEWEKYDPPISDIAIKEPGEEYDSTGFDKTARIVFNYKEGFFLNTFVTTNVIQDLGEVVASKNENIFFHKYDTIYVKFDKSVKVKPGDYFSVYSQGGEVKHPISDRAGFLYTTTAQVKTIKKIDDVWECYIFDQSGIVQRKDRLTVFTPKIGKIAKTFGKRSVEAAIIGSYRETLTGISFGDVVYLDRGRADGVELGNVFDVYGFVDRGTDKKISATPTYKLGELAVINLTDNFATALVTYSLSEIQIGSISLMKTQEEAARALKIKKKDKLKDVKQLETKSLDELDVELNLDDVSQDILNKADKVQLSEDEIEELNRQERDKSVIKDADRDVKELDRLESEILDAEKSLNESKVDEDKYLEQSNLEEHERKAKQPDPNAFEAINEIEKDIGRKYLDEDINNKENPYGLTEFDLEEIDELLNTGQKK